MRESCNPYLSDTFRPEEMLDHYSPNGEDGIMHHEEGGDGRRERRASPNKRTA